MSCDELIGGMTIEEAVLKLEELGQNITVVSDKTVMLDALHIDEPAEMPENPKPQIFKPIPFKRDYAKVGRNAPCPCQSGNKFKHCCQARALGQTPRPKPEGFEADPVIENMFIGAGK